MVEVEINGDSDSILEISQSNLTELYYPLNTEDVLDEPYLGDNPYPGPMEAVGNQGLMPNIYLIDDALIDYRKQRVPEEMLAQQKKLISELEAASNSKKPQTLYLMVNSQEFFSHLPTSDEIKQLPIRFLDVTDININILRQIINEHRFSFPSSEENLKMTVTHQDVVEVRVNDNDFNGSSIELKRRPENDAVFNSLIENGKLTREGRYPSPGVIVQTLNEIIKTSKNDPFWGAADEEPKEILECTEEELKIVKVLRDSILHTQPNEGFVDLHLSTLGNDNDDEYAKALGLNMTRENLERFLRRLSSNEEIKKEFNNLGIRLNLIHTDTVSVLRVNKFTPEKDEEIIEEPLKEAIATKPIEEVKEVDEVIEETDVTDVSDDDEAKRLKARENLRVLRQQSKRQNDGTRDLF